MYRVDLDRLRELYGRCAVSLVAADLDVFLQSESKKKEFPMLMTLPLPALMGRLDMLRLLNQRLMPHLILLGIGAAHAATFSFLHKSLSLAQACVDAKSLLFLETKMAVWKVSMSLRAYDFQSLSRDVSYKNTHDSRAAAIETKIV